MGTNQLSLQAIADRGAIARGDGFLKTQVQRPEKPLILNALTQATTLQEQSVLQPRASQASTLRSIRQKLIFAQQRLQDRHVPFQLAALSYLRITCAAMQTAQRFSYRKIYREIYREIYSESCGERHDKSCGESYREPAPSKTPYLTLVRQLTEQSSHWWELC